MTPCSDAFAWALLHFGWQAFVIAFAYKYAVYDREGVSPTIRHAFALAALVSMAFGFSFTLVYEFFRVTQLGFFYFPAANQIQQFHGHARHSSFLVRQQMHLLQGVDVFWFTGSFFFLLRSADTQWQQSRICKYACYLIAGDLYEIFRTTTERMHVNKLVNLRTHPFATGPFVCGIFKPTVYLPLLLVTGLPPDQLELILMHELAHIRRSDYAWNVFQRVLEGMFFFHPVVWWFGRILREQRELCCDSIVTESCLDPVLYAKALLKVAEFQHRQIGFVIPATGEHSPRFLLYRIKRILGEASHRPTRKIDAYNPLTIAGAVTILSLVLALGSLPNPTPIPAIRASFQSAVAFNALSAPPTIVRGQIRTTMTEISYSVPRLNRMAVEPRAPEFRSDIPLASIASSHFHVHSHPHEHHHNHTHDTAV